MKGRRLATAGTLVALAALAALAACFDSLVGSPCAPGYRVDHGACVAGDLGDAGPGSDGGSELVCSTPEVACLGACRDLSSDPDHCGVCDRACASGICTAGHCEGDLPGHVVAIGHDYRRFHGSMARVLGNAVGLAEAPNVAVARLRGSAASASSSGVSLALASSLGAIGRAWHEVPLPPVEPEALTGIDVLIIEAQLGDGGAAAALGAAWAIAIDRFLVRGGVVVALHGAGGVTHRLAEAAGLYSVPAPVTVTDQLATEALTSDAVTQAVVSPYLAEDSSVSFPLAGAAVVTTAGGAPVVLHLTRY